MTPNPPARLPIIVSALVALVLVVASLCGALFLSLLGPAAAAGCSGEGGGTGLATVETGPAQDGVLVGATEYGGPGDPSSGSVGSSGANLLAEPDSYAELGGTTFQTATAMGGLPYLTPLRISWGRRSVVAYKRDIGLGGGPIDGHARVIDLWWELARALGIPYENGEWSGLVRIAPLGASRVSVSSAAGSLASSAALAVCTTLPLGGLQLTAGRRAALLADGRAAAPSGAPPAVQGIIAAGNEIVGSPYVYGAGHGLALDEISPAYDCSSSVEHLLYGGGLLPVDYDASSTTLESFGLPGPGRWVTIYASAVHVFMYVAGLRWDTWNAAGRGDGGSGIGWHPLVRSDAGFVVRHPVGL